MAKGSSLTGKALAITFILFSITASVAPLERAIAQMTMCDGDSCTITERGRERPMTDKEVDKHFRRHNWAQVDKVRCKYTDDQARCENIVKELRKLSAY
ncbi:MULTISPECIES: hypothetical protein [unclassified Beijerinckia]|uniref:hypothetical protein n=1 Tax=unclassified Beijerinckia TaxID=2638183 RepID=UPI000894A5A5|nr:MULTISPECIES: hypothetical protein [unclassified Beijerinckia]MDH7794474.1 hypothetical protein [Beijerinckia sp. GAS462]SEB63536.1 hypothetical protein SAMN05443249_0746 [Beijerinckia sp. 28-YEA-48]